ncbi:MAG TPA: TetR/AcrR family transcriptional regulator [Polyangiaceae bacterium]|nr:TetR/AcrR family transcriptional regulator [Polyangiaceae bacterium]
MSVKANSRPDRRIQRTRRVLHSALIELILERNFDELTVQDVCERADVGRSTFYTHFADLEDLLLSGFDELRGVLRAVPDDAEPNLAPLPGAQRSGSQRSGSQPAVPHTPAPLAFSRDLIAHTHENRRLFRAMVGKRSGRAIQKRFRQLLLDLIQEDLASVLPAGAQREATAHYLTGAFFELLMWWHETRNSFSTEELDTLLHRLTGSALASLGVSLGRRD